MASVSPKCFGRIPTSTTPGFGGRNQSIGGKFAARYGAARHGHPKAARILLSRSKNKASGQLELTFWRSYFGDEKPARAQGMKKVRSVVVYEGDDFEYMYTEDGENQSNETRSEPVENRQRQDRRRLRRNDYVRRLALDDNQDDDRKPASMDGGRNAGQLACAPKFHQRNGRANGRAFRHEAIINSSSDAWLLSEDEKERRVTNETAAALPGQISKMRNSRRSPPAASQQSATPAETMPPIPTPTPVPREEVTEEAAPCAAIEDDPFNCNPMKLHVISSSSAGNCYV